MIKLILAVALLALPANSAGKRPSIDKRLQDLTKELRTHLKACEAQEGVEYCSIEVRILEWRNKSEKEEILMTLKSKGAPIEKGWLYTKNPQKR